MATLSRNFQVDFLRPVLGRTDVEVVLHSAGAEDLFRALATLALDIVLTHEVPARDGPTPFVTHRLAEQAVCLVGSPARLSCESASEPGRLLQEHPVILPTQLSSIRTGFDAWVDRLDLRPQIVAEVDDMAMMRVLMREDIGLGVMPAIVVKDELASGLLAQSKPLPGISEVFYAVTVNRRFPNPVLSELLDGLSLQSRSRAPSS
jgi:LysR family transcriptional activator of nhaA